MPHVENIVNKVIGFYLCMFNGLEVRTKLFMSFTRERLFLIICFSSLRRSKM